MCIIVGPEVQITLFSVQIVICTKRKRNNKRDVSPFVGEATGIAPSLVILFLELS